MPTRPAERTVSIFVPCIGLRPGSEKHLNHASGAKCGGTMQWCFAAGSHIPHEAFGLGAILRLAIGVCSSVNEALHNLIKALFTAFAERSVQRRLACRGQGRIHVCAKCNEAINKPHMAMKNSAVEVKIFTKQRFRCTSCHKRENGGCIPMIGAPTQK